MKRTRYSSASEPSSGSKIPHPVGMKARMARERRRRPRWRKG